VALLPKTTCNLRIFLANQVSSGFDIAISKDLIQGGEDP